MSSKIISAWKKKKFIDYLKRSDPAKLLNAGEKALIQVFQEAASEIPAYRRLLKEKGIDPKLVKNQSDFKRLVPLTDKTIFSHNELADLLKGGDFRAVKQLSLSSGFSGEFAYALSGGNELSDMTLFCDALLENIFHTKKRKTLFINGLAMGVKVPTSLPLAETSVRSDVILALVKKMARYYDQIILLGNPFFLKEVVEEGVEQGIDWKQCTVNLLMGEDWFPEDFRDYLARLLGIDFRYPDKGIISSTMGICELGLTLFQESLQTIQIRRLAEKDARLRSEIFGPGVEICPLLFQYHPYLFFLEELDGQLAFTTLSRRALVPLVRYRSGDRGRILTFQNTQDILTRLNYKEHIPEYKLPLVSVMGRKNAMIESNGVSITSEQIKTAIYADFETAGATTGYFRILTKDQRLCLEIQLKKGRVEDANLRKRFYEGLAKFVKCDFELHLYAYREFPYGVSLVYENKFKYI